MKYELKAFDYEKENILFYGNRFLIGNGHLGYRGTLEEYTKKHNVGLNIVGFYDQYKDKWRESLNAPNPFSIIVKGNKKTYSVLKRKPIKHEISLEFNKAIFKRFTEFDDLIISSKRFISQKEDNLLCLEYKVTSKIDQELTLKFNLDTSIYEINGPHFKSKVKRVTKNKVFFKGKTNENKYLYMDVSYKFPSSTSYIKNGCTYVKLNAAKNKTYSFYVFCHIDEYKYKNIALKASKSLFNKYLNEHKKIFLSAFNKANIILYGDRKAAFNLSYSIYHLLILANKNYYTSIPARGVSSPVYKGAIFWDTEIFLLPFFTLTNPSFARNLLVYRINTLPGAKNKAKEYNYKGAFYAWESQDTGEEACSKYNVTDPITHLPIRTYFNEAQIHICADIVYALDKYIIYTGDESILLEGGLNMIYEIIVFYMSYATKENNLYHIKNVIGPDEYHELIDDNAFTNYMIHEACEIFLKYLIKHSKILNNSDKIYEEVNDFKKRLYLPLINDKGLLEQFKGYFDLEDVSVETVRGRIRFENEYWGTKNGVADKTRVIKQADVITLMTLLNERFTPVHVKANYNFYLPYTEHGSSLSSSMYAISGFRIDEMDSSYQQFIKSASIDLSKEQKMFAGGIYIGGTHPASNAGAYLSLVYGFLGLEIKNDKLVLHPKSYKKIKRLKFSLVFKNKVYRFDVQKNNYEMEEVIYD